MKKLLMGSIVLVTFAVAIFVFQMSSCQKIVAQTNILHDTVKVSVHDTIKYCPTTCDIRGIYSGTSTASTGASGTMTYQLLDNNFAVSSVTPTGTVVTFGGYRNTCGSVIMSVYYTSNSSYYLLQGKLLTSGTTTAISGTFKNLTIPSDYGTFRIVK